MSEVAELPAVAAEDTSIPEPTSSKSNRFLTAEELAGIRTETPNPFNQNQMFEYKVEDVSVSCTRLPLDANQIASEAHKESVVKVLQKKQEQEVFAHEAVLVNALLEQQRIADTFAIPHDGVYGAINLDFISQSGILFDYAPTAYMQTLDRHVSVMRGKSLSDADIAIELAGHIFHEAVHESSTSLSTALLGGGRSLGELTPVVAQLAYYLERGYRGPSSYDTQAVRTGAEKIVRNGGTSSDATALDYDIVTCVAGELLLDSLNEAFPGRSAMAEGMTSLESCRDIIDGLEPIDRTKLVPALKGTIVRATDHQILDLTMKGIANRPNPIPQAA